MIDNEISIHVFPNEINLRILAIKLLTTFYQFIVDFDAWVKHFYLKMHIKYKIKPITFRMTTCNVEYNINRPNFLQHEQPSMTCGKLQINQTNPRKQTHQLKN